MGGAPFRQAGRAQLQDGALARRIRVVHPVIEAAPAHRVMHLPRAVGGDDHDGRRHRLHRAEFGDGDLEIAEDLQQEGLEGFVGAVQLVDQQDGGLALQRLEQRARLGNLRVDAALNSLAVGSPGRFGEADRMSWRAWSPFIAAAERSSHHSIAADRGRGSCAARTLAFSVCRCGLASGTAAAHARARCTEWRAPVGDIAAGGEQRLGLRDAGGQAHRNFRASSPATPRAGPGQQRDAERGLGRRSRMEIPAGWAERHALRAAVGPAALRGGSGRRAAPRRGEGSKNWSEHLLSRAVDLRAPSCAILPPTCA